MESDGVEEGINGLVRVAVTGAARLAEQLLRLRDEQLRAAEARDLTAAREVRARLDSEKALAIRELSPVRTDDWWKSAQPQDIGRAYATARAWENESLDAGEIRQHIDRELVNRYGIDPKEVEGEASRVVGELERREAERLRREADTERARADQDRAEGRSLIAKSETLDAKSRDGIGADPVEANEEEELPNESLRDRGEAAYDSAERREIAAESLSQQGFGAQEREAKAMADVSQAKPAAEAVKVKKAARARKVGRAAASQKEVTLGK